MSDRDEANGRLHDRDLYAWSKSTEWLLIDRQIREVDLDAVADELEKSAELNYAKPMRGAVEKLLTHLTLQSARWTLAEVIDGASITERDSTFTDARDAS